MKSTKNIRSELLMLGLAESKEIIHNPNYETLFTHEM